MSHLQSQGNSGRFAIVSDSDIEQAKECAIPQNTKKSTSWAVKVWKEWTMNRQKVCPSWDCPPHLLLCTTQSLDYWLSKFVMEVRRVDGKPYPPNSLYQLWCGIMRYAEETKPDLNFFTAVEFLGFRRTLDAQMKRLNAD